jgi:hypothetical protein
MGRASFQFAAGRANHNWLSCASVKKGAEITETKKVNLASVFKSIPN